MRAITITGFRRPALFRRMLETLAANDVAGWRVVIRIEPSAVAPEFAAIASAALAGRDHTLTVNERVLGIRDNPLGTIDSAFAAGVGLVLHLEEDMLLSPDATALAVWFERNHRPDWLCLNLLAGTCGSAGPPSDRRYADLLFPAKAFNSIGFAVRAAEWRETMRPAWLRDQTALSVPGLEIPPRGWDWSVYALVAEDPDLVTIQPALARATHTGREGGTWCLLDFHDRAFGDLQICDRVGADYRVVEPTVLPRELRAHLAVIDELTQARRALASTRRRRWFGR